jgi:hypothetical protein
MADMASNGKLLIPSSVKIRQLTHRGLIGGKTNVRTNMMRTQAYMSL